MITYDYDRHSFILKSMEKDYIQDLFLNEQVLVHKNELTFKGISIQ